MYPIQLELVISAIQLELMISSFRVSDITYSVRNDIIVSRIDDIVSRIDDIIVLSE